MSEICECGHSIDSHDSDDYEELGCLECSCPGYIEKEEDELEE
jgi:hypothetical protein